MDPLSILLLGFGGLMGGLSTWMESKNANKELQHAKEMAAKEYSLGKAYSDAQFNLQKNEALDQLGIQQTRLNESASQALGEFNTNLLSQAYGIQDARIETAMGIGNSLAAEGASGTRGNAGGEMIRAYAQQGLDRSVELQDRQNAQTLNSFISGITNSSKDIDRERASWGAGGYRTLQKESNDAYNKSIYELGQENFAWQESQMNDPWNQAFSYASNIFSGMTSGFNLADSIFDYKTKYKSNKSINPKD